MTENITIKIRISPNSAKNEIIKTDTDIKVKITAQPIENKANKALIAFLSKNFKIPKSQIEIVKGETSKEKTILFKNISAQTICELRNTLTQSE